MVGDTQVIGQDGGIIQNSDGVQVSFGPDQLDEDTTVEVVSVAKEDLGAPPPNEDYFDFVAAFDLNVEGGEINGPLQIGAPVSPDVGAPGDEVYFFQLQELPIGENGELVETWVMLDNGTIDANRSEEHTSELPSLMRSSYAVFCLKKKKK